MKINTNIWYSTSLLNNTNITLEYIEVLYSYIEIALLLICPGSIGFIKGSISKMKYTDMKEWKYECRISTLIFFNIHRINNNSNRIDKKGNNNNNNKIEEMKVDIINNNNEINKLSLLDLSHLIINTLNNNNNFSNDYTSLIMNNGIIYFTSIRK